MKKNIKRTLIGKGISAIFGGFPKDLTIGKTYELKYDFDLKQYLVKGINNRYKAISFKWNKEIPY